MTAVEYKVAGRYMGVRNREQVEQARARGLTVEQAAQRLDLDVQRVRDVWAAMDEAILGDDRPLRVYNTARTFTRPRCGTLSGYTTHRNHGEPPCPPCHAAKSRYDHARYARRQRAS